MMGDSDASSPNEMGPLLDDLRERGKACGEGVFTTNLDRAAAVLLSHQLADPNHYILRLVASAVASGATQIQVETVTSGYRIRWDGQPLLRKEVESLFTSSLGGGPRLSELAIGLSAARALYSMIELQTSDCRVLVTQNRVRLVERADHSAETALTLRQPGWFRWLRRLLGRDEIRLLSQRCCYAASRLVLPWGDALSPPPFRSRVIRFGNPPVISGEILLSQDSNPGMGCGYLVLDNSRIPATLVHHGVSYILEKSVLEAPGRLIWWSDHFDLDLSRTGPIKDADYESWREWLAVEVAQALRKASRLSPGQPDLEAGQEWLREIRDGDTLSGKRALELHQKAEESLRLQRYPEALVDARGAARLDENYLGTLATCLGLLNRFDESIPLYERAVRLFPDSAAMHGNYAGDLYLAGRQEEAMDRVQISLKLNRKYAYSVALKARILVQQHPKNALRLAREALTLDTCPASAWETVATASLLLDDTDTAQFALEKFLTLATPETLWENELPSRLEKAREQLAQLEKQVRP